MDSNHPLLGAYGRAPKLFEAAVFKGDLNLLKAAAKDIDSERSVEEVLHNYRDGDRTVLHLASLGGKTDLCKYLIQEVKLDINATDENGETPLLNAIEGRHSDTVKYLLENGARPDLANNRGLSPLSYVYAAEKDSGETAHPTSEAESTSGWCTQDIIDMLIIAAFRSKDSNLACKTYGMVWAASRNDESLLKSLAREVDKEGNGMRETIVSFRYGARRQSLLHYAATEGSCDICHYLIDTMRQNCNVRDARGETPLLNAIKHGRLKAASLLIGKGTSPDLSNDRDFSPVHYASERGYSELLELLLLQNAKVDAISCIGTPLQIAASRGKLESIKVLLRYQANVNMSLGHVHTPLLGAITAKSLECAKYLIVAGADVNLVSCGITALYLAASEGETEMVKILLYAGAQPNLTAEDELTPVEIAAINSHHDVVQTLFPKTSPISAYSKWSILEILNVASQQNATEKRKLKAMHKLLVIKSNGNLALDEKAYGKGVFWYTKYLVANPDDADVLSKRSKCWAELGFGNLALIDALDCKKLAPWSQDAYYRAGVAWSLLQRFDKAAEVFLDGLKLNKTNALLHEAAREAFEAIKRSEGS